MRLRIVDIDECNREQFYKDCDGKDSLITVEAAFDMLEALPTAKVIEDIKTEIERLHYHPKLDFVKNDEVVEMVLGIIDKHCGKENE